MSMSLGVFNFLCVINFLVVLGLLLGIWIVAWRITKKVKRENQ